MRMINDVNTTLEVEEILSISATPCWDPKVTDENNPDMFAVDYFAHTTNGCELMDLGSYKLDGTPETYQAAVKNFNSICIKAAETGYFRLSDFENFELW